jgi:hypothetical protein
MWILVALSIGMELSILYKDSPTLTGFGAEAISGSEMAESALASLILPILSMWLDVFDASV